MSEKKDSSGQVLFIDCQNWLAQGLGHLARRETRVVCAAVKELQKKAANYTNLGLETHIGTYAKVGKVGALPVHYMGLQKLSIPGQISSLFPPIELLQIWAKNIQIPSAIIVSSQSPKDGYGVDVCLSLMNALSELTDGQVRNLPILPLYCYLASGEGGVDPNFNLSQLEKALAHPSFGRDFCDAVVYRPNDQIVKQASGCLKTHAKRCCL